MSRKFKKLVRSVSESAGVSHAGAVNLLRRGSTSPSSLRPLDPVLIRSKAKPLFGEHTHEAGLVSAILPDGSVCVTPACPRNTLGGVSFYRYETLVRYSAPDVRPYRLKTGERFARFVESVFDEVSYDPATAYTHEDLPWLFRKSPESESFIIDERGESILSVSRPKNVVIPMWPCKADLVEDGVIVGTDAVKVIRSVRERMVALMDCASLDFDLSAPSDPAPNRIPDGCEWAINEIDDKLTRDFGMVLPPSSVSKSCSYGGRYPCGSGKVGRYVVGHGSRGLLLLRSDVTVVCLPRGF